MKCPYCQKEMQKGFIPVPRLKGQRLKEHDHLPLFDFGYIKGAKVLVGEDSLSAVYKITAYHCEDCGIFLAKEDR